MAHYNLGNVIADQGRLDEAVAEYREALRLRNDYAEAHCNLGLVLQAQHHFADALAELKRGHELGSRRPGWPYPSAEWVRSAKRLVAVDARLPQLLARESQPEDAEECLVLAHFCREHRKRFLAAARWYAEAFAAQPTLANDPSTGNRYNAACAAAMAGVGQGVDADKLDASERARLRQQAADWLRADLAVWRKALEKDPSRAAAVVRAQLQHWLEDPDFAGVRGPKALAGLPEAERAVWRQLWTEVEQLLPRAGGKGPGPAACRVHPVLNDGGR